MSIAGKTILITGANGFLGSSVCAAFQKENANVIALHRAGSDTARLDKYASGIKKAILADDIAATILDTKPDLVVHIAAAQDGGDDAKSVNNLVQSNLLFGTLLLTALKEQGVKYFINTGTSWQSYDQAEYDPVNLYAATKQAFETILKHYTNNGLQAVTLRLFDTYGQDDPRPKITNLLKRIAASGEALAMSPGEQQFDLVHVDDVAGAYVAAAKNLLDGKIKSGSVLAVSSGRPVKLKDFTALFEKARNVKCNIEWGGRPYRPREVMETWKTGKTVPGWQPRIALEDGLQDL